MIRDDWEFVSYQGGLSLTQRKVRYGSPSVEKALGALPVVAEFCRRLDIVGIVDRACPIRNVAAATHGQVIEALVANRLTSPTPLVRVEDWARAWCYATAKLIMQPTQ